VLGRLRVTYARRSSAYGVSSSQPVRSPSTTCQKLGMTERAVLPMPGAVGVDGQLAPGQDPQALLGGDRLDGGAGGGGLGLVLRQEGGADGVVAALGQLDVQDGAQEGVRGPG
jgi:hypothetical protein